MIPPVLFIAVVVTAPEPTAMIWQFVLGAAVFAFGLVLFFVAGFGAGAVKLMGGAALFIPLSNAFYAFGVLVAVLFASAFIIVQIRKAFGSEDSDWHVLAKAVLPMSLPIGAATLAAMFVF
jgi:prepilin peptidase CpaA